MLLLIYAHPTKEGHCGFVLEKIKSELGNKKIAWEMLDLYAIGYDPVLGAEEHYTAGHYEISPENRQIQEKIKAAEKIIIVYPTWWNGPPAILKGFFDRVLVSRYAFVYEGLFPTGLLKGKKVAVITTMGSPRIIGIFYSGDRSIKTVVRDTLRFCGINARGFVLGSSRKKPDEKWKNKAGKKIISALRFLEI